MLELIEIVRRKATRLQEEVIIKNSVGKPVGRRFSDFFDGDRFMDAKAYEDVTKISGSMSTGIRNGGDVRPGQAFLDFVDMGNNPGLKKGYVFGANAKGKEIEILEVLMSAAKKEGNKKALIGAWGLEGSPKEIATLFSSKLKQVKKQFTIEVAEFEI